MNAFSKRDTWFLFKKFPLDLSINLQDNPIEIYSGVYLAQAPFKLFDIPSNLSDKEKAEEVAFIEWSYPGFHLRIINCDVSIKIDSSVSDEMKKRYFWTFITALLLVKPLLIHVAGIFTYHEPDTGGRTRQSGKYDLRTNLSLQTASSYNIHDLEMAKQLFPVLLKYLNQSSNLRLFYSIQQFQRAFILNKLHYISSIFLELFPLIDSLAGNPTSGNINDISERLGKFLTNVLSQETTKAMTQEEITERLSYIWGLHRYPELHGHIKETYPDPTMPNSSPNLFPNDENLKDLRDLAEMARVCLLKILLLDESDLEKYCQIPIPLTGKSKGEANEDNKNRRTKATVFFNEQYENKPILKFYSDLKPLK